MKTPKIYLIAGIVVIIAIALTIFTSRRTITIEQRLEDGLISIAGNEGNVLEVSTMKLSQEFQDKDKLEITYWGIPINAGTTEAYLRIPVTYRFHILLTDKWRVKETKEAVIIIAPKVRPSIPPSPDMSEATWRSSSGWLRFNKQEVLERVQKSVTLSLGLRAQQYATKKLVRDASRDSIAKFLTQSFSFLTEEAKGKIIVVKFTDESEENGG